MLYAQAMAELENGEHTSGLWAKAYSEANGDQNNARALYIRYRVKQLLENQRVGKAERAEKLQFKCPQCEETFSTTKGEVADLIYSPKSQYMTCPKCKHQFYFRDICASHNWDSHHLAVQGDKVTTLHSGTMTHRSQDQVSPPEDVPKQAIIEHQKANKYLKRFDSWLIVSMVFGLFRSSLLKTNSHLSDQLVVVSFVLWVITGVYFSKAQNKSEWWGIIAASGIPGLILLFIIFWVSNKIEGLKKQIN